MCPVHGVTYVSGRTRGSCLPRTQCGTGRHPFIFMFYVYVLKSLKDKRLYVGYTSDLKSRFLQHQAGKVASTKLRRPLRLLFYEAFCSQADARRERYLKTSKGKATLKQVLRCGLQTL